MRPTRRAFLTALLALPIARPTPRVVCFGDSITVGVGASSPDRAYAALVARALGRTLDNRAVSGSRIAEQLAQIRATAIGPCDVAVLLAGYNDMRAGTPLDVYRTRLAAALAHLCAASLVVVGTCPRMTPEGYAAGGVQWGHGSDAAVAAINQVIVATAAQHRCQVAYTSDAYDPAHTNDLSHPDDMGHAQLAGAMLAALQWRVALPLVAKN